MPNPTPGDVHVNAPLTNISLAYIQSASDYVADKVFPTVPVQKQSDLYYIYSQNDFLRDEARPRAPGTETAGGGFNVSTASYSAVVEGYHKDVDDQVRANADSVLSLDRAATEFVTQKMLIRRERRWHASYFSTGIWGTDVTPGTLWSAASSTPRANVDTGKAVVKGNTGFQPNTLVLGYDVFMALRSNADVRDQFKYVSAESIDANMLAGYFGVERVLVSSAMYATNTEGAAGAYNFAAGATHRKSALLCYTTNAPSLMQPTAGYVFGWTGYLGAINGVRIKRFRMENLGADRIEGEIAYDMKLVSGALGYFFSGAVA